jgi:pimeloyl-ACP methyl ester carboxylesterase
VSSTDELLDPSSGSGWVPWLGAAAATATAAAAGAVAGLVAERAVVGRTRRRPDHPWGLGQVRGDPRIVEMPDGVEVYVEVDEPAHPTTAPTVVLVHGYSLNLDSWHFQRLGLRGTARLVLYDQRCHGRSGRGAPETSSLDQLGKDLHHVLDAVVPDGPLILVGHSMGGMTIMKLADQDPDYFRQRVVGVALFSTSPGELAEVTLGVPLVLARSVRRLVPRLVAAAGRNAGIVERGRQVGSDLGVLLTRLYAFAGPTPPELSDFALEMINATPVDVIAQFYPTFLSHDALDALDVLDGIETLVLVGAQDKLTPPEHSRQIVRALPGAELVVLDPGGHLVMLERPDDVNDHLFDLIERAGSAARSSAEDATPPATGRPAARR